MGSYGSSGGLVGSYGGAGTITNSYASGDVSVAADSPNNATASYGYSGGLVGYNTTDRSACKITNSYVSGNISGTGHNGYIYIGGIFGNYSSGQMTSVYYNSAGASKAAGSGSPTGILGLSSANLKKKLNFINWDFNEIWNIDEDISYPYLREIVSSSSSEAATTSSSSIETTPSSSSEAATPSSSSDNSTPILLSQTATANTILAMHNAINLQVQSTAKLEIYNLSGKLQKSLNLSNGVYNIPLGSLPKGMYIASVKFSNPENPKIVGIGVQTKVVIK